MLAGLRSDDGALYVTETVPPQFQLIGGVAVGTQGALYVSSALAPQVFPNGFGVRSDGRLCIAYGAPITQYEQGLPFSSDGRLVCQLNQPVSQGDAYVGTIRVGPLGGVYVVDLTPPVVSAFSTGFDQGFA